MSALIACCALGLRTYIHRLLSKIAWYIYPPSLTLSHGNLHDSTLTSITIVILLHAAMSMGVSCLLVLSELISDQNLPEFQHFDDFAACAGHSNSKPEELGLLCFEPEIVHYEYLLLILGRHRGSALQVR